MLKKILSTDPNTFINVHLSILLLRVGAGALILTHGYPKLMKVISGDFSFGDPLGLGPELSLVLVAFAEGICGLLVAAGFWTRLSAFVLTINMTIIVFVAHTGDPFGSKEKGLLFLVMFVVLLLTGGGKYSMDAQLSKK